MVQLKEKHPAKSADVHLERFSRFEREASQPSWLLPLRKAGLARFAELGFPTLRDEDWRFTNVAPIAKLPFKPVFDAGSDGISAKMLGKFAFAELDGPRLVFVNGHFEKGLSAVPSPVKGVKVGSLKTALDSDSAFLEKHFGRYVSTEKNAFAALNTAFFQDGAFIHVPAGVTVAEPIRLLFISSAREAGAATHPRNLVIAEKQSRLTVIESYVRTADAPYFTNAVTELVVGDDGMVEHLKFQDESREAFHVATVHGLFGRHSRVQSHSFALGARLSRNNIHAKLAGEGLECILNGLYLTKDEQIADQDRK